MKERKETNNRTAVYSTSQEDAKATDLQIKIVE